MQIRLKRMSDDGTLAVDVNDVLAKWIEWYGDEDADRMVLTRNDWGEAIVGREDSEDRDLMHCLYDMREMGVFEGQVDSAILPNGRVIPF